MSTIKHDYVEELKKADLKVTPARLGVLSTLEKSDTPQDIITIINHLKNQDIKADRVTVFRIINILATKGLAIPIQLNEGKLRYEYGPKANHHHFFCENCGNIQDISDCNTKELEKNISKKKGLLIKKHSLEFFGLCKNCQK